VFEDCAGNQWVIISFRHKKLEEEKSGDVVIYIIGFVIMGSLLLLLWKSIANMRNLDRKHREQHFLKLVNA